MYDLLTLFALPTALGLCTPIALASNGGAQTGAPVKQAVGTPQRSVGSASARRTVLTALGSIDSAGASAETVSRAISRLGSEAVDPLLDVLIEGQFAEPVGEFGNITRSVQRAHLSAMTQAIQLLPWEGVRGIIKKRLGPGETLRARLILSRLLAEVAQPSDLSMLGTAVAGDGSAIPRESFRSYGAALSRWIRRDPAAASYFPELVQTVHPSLLRISIEALRASAPESVLDGLSGSLGTQSRFDPILLMEIAYESKTARRPAAPGVLAKIRAFVNHPDPSCALEAVSAVGRLDDVGSIEGLIALMKSGGPSMQSRAKEALESLADERLGSDASAWGNWFAAATEWRDLASQDVRSRLRNGPVSQRSQALLELARYRVFRHELDDAVIEALRDDDEGVVVIACAVLGHYATVPCTNALVEALGAESVKVRKGALDALHRCTGERHGELKSDWVAAGWGLPSNATTSITIK